MRREIRRKETAEAIDRNRSELNSALCHVGQISLRAPGLESSQSRIKFCSELMRISGPMLEISLRLRSSSLQY